MKDLFKPEDFESQTVWAPHSRSLAYIANKKLNKLIESWPVVYGSFGENQVSRTFGQVKVLGDTHTARLAFIEEIVKEPCKHEPSRVTSFQMAVDVSGNEYFRHRTTCQYCGIELEAKWGEVK